MARERKRTIYDTKVNTILNGVILPKNVILEFKRVGLTLDLPSLNLIEECLIKYYKQYLTLKLEDD